MSRLKIKTIPRKTEAIATISDNPIPILRAFSLISGTPIHAMSSAPKKKSSPCNSIIIPVVVNTIFGVMIFPLIKVINILDSTMLLI